jgi:hypothetical protein
MGRRAANEAGSHPRPAPLAHRSQRAALDPFLIEEITLTRDEVLRARAADPYWQRPVPAAA